MLCQHCQKRVANVHFSQVINNNKVEMYLCEQCAKAKGQINFSSFMNINDFFSGLMGFNQAAQYMGTAPVKENVCDKCGMSYEEFQRHGKLGCANCYGVFGDKLKPLVKRLHGSITHTGKIPVKLSKAIKVSKKIDKLKSLLGKAIQNEEYEKAAEIRDKIKAMEAENVNGS